MDKTGEPVLRRQLRRSQMLAFFQRLPGVCLPGVCLVGMEACASAHYWARELTKLGHEVRLMQPSYVKGYVRRGKTDKADAEANCEAVSRPSMRFVPVKSEDTQALLMTRKTRAFLVRQQTQIVNAMRAHPLTGRRMRSNRREVGRFRDRRSEGHSQRRAPDRGM